MLHGQSVGVGMKIGDLVRTIFDHDRTGIIISDPIKLLIGGSRHETFVSVLWDTGTHDLEYNTAYLEVIND